MPRKKTAAAKVNRKFVGWSGTGKDQLFAKTGGRPKPQPQTESSWVGKSSEGFTEQMKKRFGQP